MDKKHKIKVTLSINRKLYKEIDELTTNKSFLIEQLLFNYASNNEIKNNDVIL
jgi:hypothetical protein